MTNDERNAFLLAVKAAFREKRAVPDCAVKRLSRMHLDVADKLAHWPTATPTHKQLARAAGCSERTVRNALAVLIALGLLESERRIVSVCGWRAQIANGYRLLPGAGTARIRSIEIPLWQASFAGSDAIIAALALAARFRTASTAATARPTADPWERTALAAVARAREAEIGQAWLRRGALP